MVENGWAKDIHEQRATNAFVAQISDDITIYGYTYRILYTILHSYTTYSQPYVYGEH